MEDYFAAFPGKEDVLRYVLTAIAPESKDADFSWKDFQTRNNSELVAILGNFVNRVMVLSHKFYGGSVPANPKPQQQETELAAEMARCAAAINENIRGFKFREALFELINMARAGNKYLADEEPWKTVKTDADRTATVMFHAVQVCAQLAWWMDPFLPFTSSRLLKMLNTDKTAFANKGFQQLESGHMLGAAEHLFSNIEDEPIQQQIELLLASKTSLQQVQTTPKPAEAQKPNITFDDFSKMDIRTGIVLAAEKVKKADKLLQLTVDLGYETRTVVSGIALHFKPEELIGRQVTVLANLEPRTIKGIESKGMILMAEDSDGSLKLLGPDAAVMPGSTVS